MNNKVLESLDADIRAKIEYWLSDNFDTETRQSIQNLIDEGNTKELIDSFYRSLEFGTGGLRGLMGAGSNRMNQYTVAMATQGLANYLKESFKGEDIKVAIAYDSRNNSPYFAKVTSEVFAGNGFTVYLYPELRPTPQLSYTIRRLKCHSGVVLTASHNPKEYNGYKAYWNDGAQMISPHDKNTITAVEAIKGINEVKRDASAGKIILLGKEDDEAYINQLLGNSVSKEAIKRQSDLKIVYSPLHGTGVTLLPEVLKRMGFTNVNVVKEQAIANGNFPTVVYPNPEEAEALTMALAQAIALDADLVLATDPDADRVGIASKNRKGEWQLLNGNQTAALFFYYMLEAWKSAGKLDGNQYIVKTIVTSDILNDMAAAYNVGCYDTLTGFKYIAGVMRELEGKKQFIVGGEESYGYLAGDFVRDKDGVGSAALIAEMTAWAKDKGMNLFDLLAEIYQRFGFYKEGLISITKKGKEGAEEIKAMMQNWRSNPPKSIAGSPIVKVIDYQELTIKDLVNGSSESFSFEKSNVLQFVNTEGTKVSARPSGTEPKIKFYISDKLPLKSTADFEKVEAELDGRIAGIRADLGL